jgi:hypothetical protein
MHWFVLIFTFLATAPVLSGCSNSDSSSSANRFFQVFQSQGKQLKLHVLDDDLVHLEWSGLHSFPMNLKKWRENV